MLIQKYTFWSRLHTCGARLDVGRICTCDMQAERELNLNMDILYLYWLAFRKWLKSSSEHWLSIIIWTSAFDLTFWIFFVSARSSTVIPKPCKLVQVNEICIGDLFDEKGFMLFGWFFKLARWQSPASAKLVFHTSIMLLPQHFLFWDARYGNTLKCFLLFSFCFGRYGNTLKYYL